MRLAFCILNKVVGTGQSGSALGVCSAQSEVSPPPAVGSWFLSPVLSGIMSALVFVLVRTLILRKVRALMTMQNAFICMYV